MGEEVHERYPGEKDYRHCVRSIAAGLRRNTMLAAGYTSGRIPPQWIINSNGEALAPRFAKLGTRVIRKENLHDALQDEETAELRRRAKIAGNASELAPPPQNENGGVNEGIFT